MPTLAEKIRFAETYITNARGEKFSLRGRSWVRDEFWLPADGFKLWGSDSRDACDDCRDHIGEIIEHQEDNPTAKCKRKCSGLDAHPILVTVLNLHRQDGKTFNTMAYTLATMFKSRNKSFGLLTASEDQGEAIYRENYKTAIDRSKRLASRSDAMRTRLKVAKQNCLMEILTTSHRSLTGRTRTHLLIDEARDIEAQAAAKLLPSVAAMHGVECPAGHVQLSPEDVEELASRGKRVPKKCTACGSRLSHWYPRIIITSSSGVIQGNSTDWFMELVELLQAEPDPNYHLFHSQEPLNPRKSPVVTDALERGFGQLDTMRPYIAAEFGNKFVSKDQDVVSIADVKRCMDRSLGNTEDLNLDPCVGFLDTSTTVEKTSLVVLAEDTEQSTEPWEYIYQAHLEFWTPAKTKRRVMDGKQVLQALEMVLPLLRGLVTLFVDVKVGAVKDLRGQWPAQMMHEIRESKHPWRKRVHAWKGGGPESDLGWELMIERILLGTVRLQYSPETLAEFKGVTMKTPKQSDRKPRVVDKDRRKMHKDITEGLAVCNYLIHMQQQRGRSAGLAQSQRRASARDNSAVRNQLAQFRKQRKRKFNPTSGIDPNSL